MSDCIYIKDNGEQCKAKAIKDSDYCFTHNPDTKIEKQMAVVKGGLNSKRVRLGLMPLSIETPHDINILLADTINRVRSGEMPPNIANTIGYLSGVLIKSYDTTKINERLISLQEALSN
jgi:hypothetical protein